LTPLVPRFWTARYFRYEGETGDVSGTDDVLIELFFELHGELVGQGQGLIDTEQRQRLDSRIATIRSRYDELVNSLDGQSSTFFGFVRENGLSWDETLILAFLIADDRQAVLDLRTADKGRTGSELIMTLLGGDYYKRSVFYLTGRLLKQELIERIENDSRSGARNVLSFSYRITERGIREALGHESDSSSDDDEVTRLWGDLKRLPHLEDIQSEDLDLGDVALDDLDLGDLMGRSSQSTGGSTGDHRIIEPKTTMEDVVLPEEMMESVRTVLVQVTHKDLIFDKWGLGDKGTTGRGIPLLFSGPPGTGKTLLAHAIANALERPVMEVRYPDLVSAYVGETGKNIKKVFDTASEKDAVLLWDEADAMFNRRQDRPDGVEQSFNRVLNILLTEVDRFDGVVILTTNRGSALDLALERRLALKLIFPEPDRTMRGRIWRKLIPSQMPVKDLDVDVLAEHDLTGGQIHNVILNAARLGCTRSPPMILQADFIRAMEMERAGADAMRYNLSDPRKRPDDGSLYQ